MVNDINAKRIAKYAIMLATIFVAMLLDRAISTPLALVGFSTAVCVLLVTVSISLLENNWLSAILSWLFFGLASIIKEFIFLSPLGLVGVFASIGAIYVIPIICIVPRVVAGSLTFATYKLLQRQIGSSSRKQQTWCLSLSAFVGAFLNTVFFLLVVSIFHNAFTTSISDYFLQESKTYSNVTYWGLIVSSLLNIAVEWPLVTIIVPQVVLGVRRGLKLPLDGGVIC